MGGARTPEELETLLEDALLMRCPDALASLFADGAVLAASDRRQARGRDEIARLAMLTWGRGQPFVADPDRVVQARDIALVVSGQTINVVQRDATGEWRFAIVLKIQEQEGTH
jgi:hypothetical protein